MDSVQIILSSSVIVSIVLLILLRLFRKTIEEWIVKNLHAKIQHEYDQRLETLKSQLTNQNEVSWLKFKNQLQEKQSLIESVRSSFMAGQSLSAERRLNAIDQLWTEIVAIRNIVPPVMKIVDALKENETAIYTNYLGTTRANDATTNWSIEEFESKVNSISKSIEEIRPYIGEYLWAVFQTYRAIHIRICVKLQIDEDNADNVVKWYEDEMIQDMILTILDEKEFKLFNSKQYGKLGWLQRSLEQKILFQLEKFISGEFYSDDTQRKFAIDALQKISESEIRYKNVESMIDN